MAGEAETFLKDPLRRHAMEIDAPPMSLKECLDRQNRNLVKVNIDEHLCERRREFRRISCEDDYVVARSDEGDPSLPLGIDRGRAWSIQEERAVCLHTGINEADRMRIAHAAKRAMELHGVLSGADHEHAMEVGPSRHIKGSGLRAQGSGFRRAIASRPGSA